MDEREELPRIVVKPAAKPLPAVGKKRRHPAKVGMLMAIALWPAAFCAITAAMTFLSIAASERKSDGNYYHHVEGVGWRGTSIGEIVLSSACCAGFGSTFLFAAALAVLWIFWFATKPD